MRRQWKLFLQCKVVGPSKIEGPEIVIFLIIITLYKCCVTIMENKMRQEAYSEHNDNIGMKN